LQAGASNEKHRRLHFDARADAAGLRVSASEQGSWPLPYAQIRVVLPDAEVRTLSLSSAGVRLAR